MIVLQDENANRDNEIAAIFNPKRVRTPSVTLRIAGESPNGPSSFGTSNVNQITHSDSVTSSHAADGAESLSGIIISDNIIDSHSHQQPNSLTQIIQNQQLPRSAVTENEKPKGSSCCSELAQKVKQTELELINSRHTPCKSLLDVLRRLCNDFNHILLGWDDPLF